MSLVTRGLGTISALVRGLGGLLPASRPTPVVLHATITLAPPTSIFTITLAPTPSMSVAVAPSATVMTISLPEA